MDKLKALVEKRLKDTLYEADVAMRSDRSKRLTLITDNLRGLCGITVCTVTEASKHVSKTVEATKLKIKFQLLEQNMDLQLAKMQIEARKIDGIYSFIATRVGKVKNRIYRT
tara:strand:+ start:2571 stop:2906 length:336 start_codon:yes stop_codon:yes gene_type:complete